MSGNVAVELEAKLSEDEQKLLDSALLESEQLLARSLREEQRRRSMWLSILAVVAIAATGAAGFGLGRVTSDMQVTEEAQEAGISDDEWRSRLLAVKEDDSWFDGAQLGMQLLRIPGERPFKILSENWDDISINARQQILKGFTPGMMGNKILHEFFFDVMDLGMTDPHQEVRDYAAVYLEMQGLRDFAHDPDGYAEWRKANKNRPAREIVKSARSQTVKEVVETMIETAEDSEFKRAWQLFFSRDYVESEKLFHVVLEREPENPHAMNGLGWSLLNQKHYDKAKPWLEKAIEIEKNHWGALNGLAVVLRHKGNIDEAVEIWERCAAASPDTPTDATLSLAEIYMDRKEYAKAADCYRKLIKWYPEQDAFKQKLVEAEAGRDKGQD